MRIKDLYGKKKIPLSFEIFPPKGDLDFESFVRTLGELKKLDPAFISVTYSAGGSGNSGRTVRLASIVKNEYGIEVMAHLTCINSDANLISERLNELKKNNIENILALRGDKIGDEEPKEFHHASDLISYIDRQDFCIGAGCYPEGHPESLSLEDDIKHLKMKQDAGADFLITQLFFDNSFFYLFRDKAAAAGVSLPISVGIMPLLSVSQVSRMTSQCGASLPDALKKIIDKYGQNPDDLRKAGIEYSCIQSVDLLKNGIDGLHIYTMNKPDIAIKQLDAVKNLL